MGKFGVKATPFSVTEMTCKNQNPSIQTENENSNNNKKEKHLKKKEGEEGEGEGEEEEEEGNKFGIHSCEFVPNEWGKNARRWKQNGGPRLCLTAAMTLVNQSDGCIPDSGIPAVPRLHTGRIGEKKNIFSGIYN